LPTIAPRGLVDTDARGVSTVRMKCALGSVSAADFGATVRTPFARAVLAALNATSDAAVFAAAANTTIEITAVADVVAGSSGSGDAVRRRTATTPTPAPAVEIDFSLTSHDAAVAAAAATLAAAASGDAALIALAGGGGDAPARGAAFLGALLSALRTSGVAALRNAVVLAFAVIAHALSASPAPSAAPSTLVRAGSPAADGPAPLTAGAIVGIVVGVLSAAAGAAALLRRRQCWSSSSFSLQAVARCCWAGARALSELAARAAAARAAATPAAASTEDDGSGRGELFIRLFDPSSDTVVVAREAEEAAGEGSGAREGAGESADEGARVGAGAAAAEVDNGRGMRRASVMPAESPAAAAVHASAAAVAAASQDEEMGQPRGRAASIASASQDAELGDGALLPGAAASSAEAESG
jgi:hypothetical protein